MPDSCPTISVVIAARDSGGTIQDAVRSALHQTSPANEVIVVDDGSVDGTRQRVLELTSDRVVVVDGDGRGVSVARNAGIMKASGSWIAFLDGDDYWEPDFLRQIRARIAAEPGAVACFGAATPIDDAGRLVGRHDMPERVTLTDLVNGRVVPTTSATAVRREAVIGCEGFYENFRRAAGVEDLDLWWRLAAIGPCLGVGKPAALYVVHDARDRCRSAEELSDLEHDRESVVDRFAASGASPDVVRRSRAIMRARTARYWLRADNAARARAVARSSLKVLPTLEGLVTLALASSPGQFREGAVLLRRLRRAGLRRRSGSAL
jgi:glycosyltransferase involved in cell wall biosynthesis